MNEKYFEKYGFTLAEMVNYLSICECRLSCKLPCRGCDYFGKCADIALATISSGVKEKYEKGVIS